MPVHNHVSHLAAAPVLGPRKPGRGKCGEPDQGQRGGEILGESRARPHAGNYVAILVRKNRAREIVIPRSAATRNLLSSCSARYDNPRISSKSQTADRSKNIAHGVSRGSSEMAGSRAP